MAKLYFKVGSDWEEVVRLRNEIAKLKQELMSMYMNAITTEKGKKILKNINY